MCVLTGGATAILSTGAAQPSGVLSTPDAMALAQPTHFFSNVRCGQTAGWTKMPLGMEVGLDPGKFMFDGDPAPPRKNGRAPTQFLAHVYCGQTAGWIKMRLGTEVNLVPGDVVLDGVTAPP